VIFTAAALPGLFVVDLEPRSDERGFFARSFCADEFARLGLAPVVAQCNVSYNAEAGCLRGLHGARPDHAEAKLVRCTAGAVWDVVVDARRGSPALGRWVGIELSAANRRAVYVPPGCLHGFVTLTDGAELFYQMSEPYRPAADFGVRWDDPELAIAWPVAPKTIADKDRMLPSFRDAVERIT